MFSLLWSEHCAYKHSKKLLRTLPTEGPHVVMGPGENAGAVDVGGGCACAFKVESHNHPSAVEPFQGAATGVGGILRDIFAIGARPIAVLDSLRFGEARQAGAGPARASERATCSTAPSRASATTATRSACRRSAARSTSRRPTSRTAWSTRWRSGWPSARRVVRSAAAGPATWSSCSARRPAATGSAARRCSRRPSSATPDDDDKRPTVQVGDPFEEKKLLECSLELLERGLLVSLQDLGAAGLTSVGVGDGLEGRRRDRHRRRRGAAARGRHGAVRDHGLRVPGADAVRGRARQRSTRCWRCARSGRSAAR